MARRSGLIEAVPVAPLVPLVGLSVAALSYAGTFAASVNADSSVTELEVMADGVGRAFDDLHELAQNDHPSDPKGHWRSPIDG